MERLGRKSMDMPKGFEYVCEECFRDNLSIREATRKLDTSLYPHVEDTGTIRGSVILPGKMKTAKFFRGTIGESFSESGHCEKILLTYLP